MRLIVYFSEMDDFAFNIVTMFRSPLHGGYALLYSFIF